MVIENQQIGGLPGLGERFTESDGERDRARLGSFLDSAAHRHHVGSLDHADTGHGSDQVDRAGELVVGTDSDQRTYVGTALTVDVDGDGRFVGDEQRCGQAGEAGQVRAEGVGARAVAPAAGQNRLHSDLHVFLHRWVSGRIDSVSVVGSANRGRVTAAVVKAVLAKKNPHPALWRLNAGSVVGTRWRPV